METFIIGKKEVTLSDCQAKNIQFMPVESTGFELAYLSKWPYLRADVQFKVPSAVIDYFNSNQNLFCQDTISHNAGWSYLALMGSLDFTFLDSEVLSFKLRHADIQIREGFLEVWPEFGDLMKNLPLDVVSAAVFALQPGSNIAVHTDKKLHGIDKLLIPLNKPKGAFFAFYEYGVVPLEEGGVYAIDASFTHYAANQSNEIRYHLIVRGCLDNKLDRYFDWLKNSHQKYGAPTFANIPEGDQWRPSNYVKKT